METIKLNTLAVPLDRDMAIDKDKAASLSDKQKLKVAHDFESVLLTRLVDEMKATIPDSELSDDGSSEQVQSLFYMNIADEIGKKGGMGLWKTIYAQINASQDKPTMDASL